MSKICSIIIPVHNNLNYTKQCIDSIFRHTSFMQCEVIVVDNASDQATKDYLKTLANVKVIYSETNEGYAKATNKGIAASHCDFVFLLNNDTILYPDWLPRMLAAFDEKTGAVGPMSNYVMGKQMLSIGRKVVYPEQIHNAISVNFKGNTVDAEFLIGFALMVSRKAIKEIGMLDERFFAGSEDLDFSLRLRRAGYKLKIARDVFVQHFGQRTSQGVLNQSEQFYDECNALFFEKWSQELGTEIKGHRQAFEAVFGVRPSPLTITTITRNESGLVQNMIKTTNAFCSDYCIVDTGSTDDTVTTLRRLLLNNGEVIQYGWNDNFAAARNTALSRCRGKWVLQLDSDEIIEKQHAVAMQAMLEQSEFDAFRFTIINFEENPFLIKHAKYHVLNSVRMWKNHKDIRYEGICHETITDSLTKLGYKIALAPVPILHHCYGKTGDRHFSLMKQTAEKEPHRSNNHFFLGEQYIRQGQLKLAICCFKNALSTSQILTSSQSYYDKVSQMLQITEADLTKQDISGFSADVLSHYKYLKG